MHKHTHCRLASQSVLWRMAEARLCFDELTGPERLQNAEETLKAGQELLRNPHIREAMDAYKNAINQRFNAQFSNPADRANFFAILLSGMMLEVPLDANGRLQYNTVAVPRSSLNVTNPLLSLSGADLKRAEAEWKRWNATPGSTLSAVTIDQNIQRYLDRRETLNEILRRNNIAAPDRQTANAPSLGGLSRNEYFDLLCLLCRPNNASRDWEVEIASHATAIPDPPTSGLNRLRAYLGSGTDRALDRIGPVLAAQFPSLNRQNAIRTDITLDLLGPTETLTRFGIVLGPYLMHTYIEQRAKNPAGTPSAALWEEQPMLAYQFLNQTAFRELPANKNFLDALEHYFRPNPSVDAHRMSRGDVQAILSMVVRSVRLAEEPLDKSREVRSEMRTRIDIAQRAEKEAQSIFKYTREFRKHPLGSFMMGLVAFLAIKFSYRQLFKSQHHMITNIAGYGLLGGIALGLYQQNTSGTAWWHGAKNWMDRQRNRELALDPNDRSLASYWARECGLVDLRHKFCLGILEEQPITQVMDWYRRKNVDPNANVPLPFQFARSRMFGSLPEIEVQRLFHTSLKAFFVNRGRAARAGGWQLEATSAGGTDDNAHASIGEDYIRRMFVERRYFAAMASQIIQPAQAKMGADLMQQLDQEAVQKQVMEMLGPDAFYRLMMFRYLSIQEARHQPPANRWQMFYVFQTQQDSGALNAQLRSQVQGLDEYLGKVTKMSQAAIKASASSGPLVAPVTIEQLNKRINEGVASMDAADKTIEMYEQEIKNAQAALAKAEAELKTDGTNRNFQRAVRAGRARLEIARAQLEAARSDRNARVARVGVDSFRLTVLEKRRALTEAEQYRKTIATSGLSDAKTKAAVAKARVAEAAARSDLSVAEYDLRVKEADDAVATAELNKERRHVATVRAEHAHIEADALHNNATSTPGTSPDAIAKFFAALNAALAAKNAAIAAEQKAEIEVKQKQEMRAKVV